MTDFTDHPVLGNPPKPIDPIFSSNSVIIHPTESDPDTAVLVSTDGRVYRLDIGDGVLWEIAVKIED